ncbi:MAG: DctP family TRAP transporter solute-binding subunit [Pirellulales bacterium]
MASVFSGCEQNETAKPRFKMGHVYEVRAPSHKYGASKIDERLKESGCGLSVTVFPASQLGSEPELVEQLVAGELEMVIAGPSFLAMWHPPLGIFDAGFAFRDLDHMLEVADSDVLAKHWEILRQKFGVRLLDTWAYGSRHITSNKPIHSMEDLAGFQLRFPPAKIWQLTGKAIGSSPVAIPFADVYMSLQTGAVDGQENPIPVIDSMSFQRVQKYLCMTGHIQSSTVVMVNERAWQRLSADQQRALSSTIKQLGREVYQGLLQEEKEILDRWETEKEITVIRDIDLEQMRKSCFKYFSDGHPFSEIYRQTTAQYSKPDSKQKLVPND